jgi:hypothetical protein
MRRGPALLLTAVLAVGGLSACKNTDDATSDLPRPSRAFCAAAARYDERITTASLKLPEQIELVTAIAANAPEDIERDAQTFLNALEQRRDGDTSVVDNPKVETAVHNVNRRAGQDCGWYQRKGM